MKLISYAAAGAVLLGGLSQALAVPIALFEYGVNINGVVDGAVNDPDTPLPGSVDASAFSFTTGLGTLSIQVSGAGPNYVGLFVDHEIQEDINTFFNEFGVTGGIPGTPALGQSWEIDEPGFVFGDIVSNFRASSLDNGIGTANPEDVAMALAWNFNLNPDEIATIQFFLSETEPTSGPAIGFHLLQTDEETPETIYFSSSIQIRSATGVPDGGATASLLVIALGGMMLVRRKR